METVDWCEDSAHLAVAKVLHEHGYRSPGSNECLGLRLSLAEAAVKQPDDRIEEEKAKQMEAPFDESPSKSPEQDTIPLDRANKSPDIVGRVIAHESCITPSGALKM